MEEATPDPYAGAGFEWRSDGRGDPGSFRTVAVPPPSCSGCGQPVRWGDLRWRTVTEAVRPGWTHVTVEPDGPPWHPGCRRHAEWVALVAAVVDTAQVVGDVGRTLSGAGRAYLVSSVAFFESIAVASVPVFDERRRVVGQAAGAFAGTVVEDVRRGWRRIPTERGWRPVGRVAGVALVAALDVGGRVARVADYVRGRAAQEATRRFGGLGRRWSGRNVRDTADVAAVVDAVAGAQRPARGRVEWLNRPRGWAADGQEAAAGLDGPPWWIYDGPADGQWLGGWFGGHGPAGHGDVDTPPEQQQRRGRGPADGR